MKLSSNKNNVEVMLKNIDQVKEDKKEENFLLNPSKVATGSPARNFRKRPRLDDNNQITIHSYPSRLRRACDRQWDSSYTPPPILDPSRVGPGLYARVYQQIKDVDFHSENSQSNDGPPPRINIGTRYQATIPVLQYNNCITGGGSEIDNLLWDPGINDLLTDNEG